MNVGDLRLFPVHAVIMVLLLHRSKSRSPKRRPRRSPTPRPNKVHIGRLTRNVNKDHITEIFAIYGSLKNVEMLPDRNHPEFNRGFAYVEYENPDDAEKAIKHMDGGANYSSADLSFE